MLAVARTGLRLYTDATSDAPAGIGDRLREYGDECQRHVTLLEQAIRDLGGDPATASPEARLVERVSAFAIDETADSPRRWWYRLEGLLTYETRDAIIGEAIEQVAAESDDPVVAETVGRAALTVRSSAALGAHDVSRPDERIAWLEKSLRAVVLDQLGVQQPSLWQRLTGSG